MQAIGFDLDGTLLDTLADIGCACNAVLANHGYPQHPLPAYRLMVGNGFEMLVRRALPQDRMPDACALAALVAEARMHYAEHMTEQTRPYPGIVSLVSELADQGFALFVLSNKPDAMTRDLIAHYFGHIPFRGVFGARPDVSLKPDPESLAAVFAAIGAEKLGSAYVGDSNVDMQTALKFGIIAVGAAWGFRGPEELRLAGCQILLQEPKDLAGLPEKLRLAKGTN